MVAEHSKNVAKRTSLQTLEKTLKVLEKYGVTEYQNGDLKISLVLKEPVLKESEPADLEKRAVYNNYDEIVWAHSAD